MKVVKYVLSYVLANKKKWDKVYICNDSVIGGGVFDVSMAMLFDTKQEAFDYNTYKGYICQAEEYEVEVPETFNIWVHKEENSFTHLFKKSFDKCKGYVKTKNWYLDIVTRPYHGGTVSIVSNETGITHYVQIIN